MSKATEHVERMGRAEAAYRGADAARDAGYNEAPVFSCEKKGISGSLTTVTARVMHDGSLELSGWLPADKVAALIVWLGEVYGD